MASLAGTVALVTGAGRGLGRGIASVLADQGAAVVLADIDEASAVSAAAAISSESGARCIGLPLDVTDSRSCKQTVEAATAEFGQLDTLVNNAGICERVAFQQIDETGWDRMMEVNVKGAVLTSQAALVGFVQQGSGSIVNIASTVGRQATPFFAHYCASKFAVIGLTQSNALEFASRGIRVNAVCPGLVRTPMWDEGLLAAVSRADGLEDEEAWEAALGRVPLGRAPQPEDVGEMVAFLASPAAHNITGATFNVSGGEQVG